MGNFMIYFLLLTKTHNEEDFIFWYRFHKRLIPTAKFVILDNESTVNLFKLVDKNEIILPIEGFPDQHNLYNKIFNEMNIFKDGDHVVILDDDEYIYFKDKNDEMDISSFEEVIMACDKEVLMIPQILISTEEVRLDRYEKLPIPITHTYRRNDKATTCKSIIKYNNKRTYDFTANTAGGTRGHIPSIDGKVEGHYFAWWKKNGGVGVEVVTYPLVNPPFADVDYKNNIRLYHYHIKSRNDWDIKIHRGSCALKTPWYSNILENNIFYGGYNTEDIEMKELYERYSR